MSTGRYAPSPSGRMHLGNLMCCLLAWLSAKSKGGQVLLRIEDLDTQRCPRSYADAIVDDLAWLGLAADGPMPPVYQSDRSEIYQRYFDELSRRGLVYPCFCSRSQLHAASAPHRSDGQVIYAGTCRGLTPAEIAERSKTRAPAWRVQVPDEVIALEDGHMGHYEENLARDCGDFFLRRADGVFAYQLAVVVDDELMGVELTRGEDELLLGTRDGMAIRFSESDIRLMGRVSMGVKSIELAEDDEVVGLAVVHAGTKVLSITQNGYGKRTDVDEYRLQSRGGKGILAMKLTDKTGLLAAQLLVREDEDLMVITDDGTIIRLPVESISVLSRNTQGVRVMRVAEGSRIVGVKQTDREDESAEEAPEERAENTEETAQEEPELE